MALEDRLTIAYGQIGNFDLKHFHKMWIYFLKQEIYYFIMMKKLVKNLKKKRDKDSILSILYTSPLGHNEEAAFLSKGATLAKFS